MATSLLDGWFCDRSPGLSSPSRARLGTSPGGIIGAGVASVPGAASTTVAAGAPKLVTPVNLLDGWFCDRSPGLSSPSRARLGTSPGGIIGAGVASVPGAASTTVAAGAPNLVTPVNLLDGWFCDRSPGLSSPSRARLGTSPGGIIGAGIPPLVILGSFMYNPGGGSFILAVTTGPEISEPTLNVVCAGGTHQFLPTVCQGPNYIWQNTTSCMDAGTGCSWYLSTPQQGQSAVQPCTDNGADRLAIGHNTANELDADGVFTDNGWAFDHTIPNHLDDDGTRVFLPTTGSFHVVAGAQYQFIPDNPLDIQMQVLFEGESIDPLVSAALGTGLSCAGTVLRSDLSHITAGGGDVKTQTYAPSQFDQFYKVVDYRVFIVAWYDD